MTRFFSLWQGLWQGFWQGFFPLYKGFQFTAKPCHKTLEKVNFKTLSLNRPDTWHSSDTLMKLLSLGPSFAKIRRVPFIRVTQWQGFFSTKFHTFQMSFFMTRFLTRFLTRFMTRFLRSYDKVFDKVFDKVLDKVFAELWQGLWQGFGQGFLEGFLSQGFCSITFCKISACFLKTNIGSSEDC